MGNPIKWTPEEGWTCPHCGASNPDGGAVCGNCEQNVFILPKRDDYLTPEQLITYNAVVRR